MISKGEIVFYGLGVVGVITGLIYWQKKKPWGTPVLIMGSGLVLTGGALTANRFATANKALSGKGLGLSQVGVVKKGGMTLRKWSDPEMDVHHRVHLIQGLVAKSVSDPEIRKEALLITNKCPSRDEECELKAIFDWTAKNIRYTGDIGMHALSPGGPVEAVDTFQSAKRTIEFKGGDCLPAGTLLLVEGHRLVAIEDVLPGTKIWGYDRWSKVENIWPKGILSVDAVFMDNGASFRATSDHKVYTARCPSHDGSSCLCSMNDRDIVRVIIGELEPGMVLLQPDSIPFDTKDESLVLPRALSLACWRFRTRVDGNGLKLLRVKSIERGVMNLPTYDLTTDDHKVYLPEADVTISQCDDHAILTSSLAIENGFPAKVRITSNTGETWDHIYTMAGVPRLNPRRWISLDTTLGPGKFGKEPSQVKHIDFPA